MLLMDSESSSSEGGWRRDGGLGGASQTPSSIQDTLWGDCGTELPCGCCCSKSEQGEEPQVEGVAGGVGLLRLSALRGKTDVESRLGRLSTTPSGGVVVGGVGMHCELSADWALIRPERHERTQESDFAVA